MSDAIPVQFIKLHIAIQISNVFTGNNIGLNATCILTTITTTAIIINTLIFYLTGYFLCPPQVCPGPKRPSEKSLNTAGVGFLQPKCLSGHLVDCVQSVGITAAAVVKSKSTIYLTNTAQYSSHCKLAVKYW